jgi:hypothetical protein
MSVNATVSFGFVANDVRTVGLNSNTNIPCNVQSSVTFTNGAGANGAQVLFQGSYTLSGTTQTFDFFSGLTDSYGTAVVLTGVKALFVQNTGTSLITLGDASSNPWNTFLNSTGTITLNPGDIIMAATPTAAGWAVGTSTNVNFLVTGTSGQTFNIAFLGIGT